MGDGGVACVPSQHVMERFPIPDMFCGGNGGFNSKSLQFAESQVQREHEKKMKVEKEDFGSVKGRKRGAEKGELGLERGKKGEVEKDEILSNSLPKKDEMEEGELCLTKGPKAELENGEFVPDKLKKKKRKREAEKGELVPDTSSTRITWHHNDLSTESISYPTSESSSYLINTEISY